MTAFGETETRERAKTLGATAFLDKPIDLTALETVIRQVLY
jgi:CheY-like chemotaxis protein